MLSVCPSTFSADVKSDKVDAVILATPHSKHLEQIVAAVNNGKHVFVEKPITLTAEDAKIAYDEAKKNNKVLAVGFNRRFHPNFIKIVDMSSFHGDFRAKNVVKLRTDFQIEFEIHSEKSLPFRCLNFLDRFGGLR